MFGWSLAVTYFQGQNSVGTVVTVNTRTHTHNIYNSIDLYPYIVTVIQTYMCIHIQNYTHIFVCLYIPELYANKYQNIGKITHISP